jgi:hypothetical protein
MSTSKENDVTQEQVAVRETLCCNEGRTLLECHATFEWQFFIHLNFLNLEDGGQ